MDSPFTSLKADADFYIVRHGQSEGNHEGRIQGRTDLVLTEKGFDEARMAGRWFSKHSMDLVSTSPLKRARATAQTIMAEIGLPDSILHERPSLMELETGIFTNRTFRDIQEHNHEDYKNFQTHSWQGVPGAESVESIRARALEHWTWLIQQANSGKKHLMTVTHFGMVQWLWKTTLGTNMDSWFPIISVGNCSIFHLHASPRSSGLGPNCYLEWRLMNHSPHVYKP